MIIARKTLKMCPKWVGKLSSNLPMRVFRIDSIPLCGIISSARRSTSSMAEQLTLNQWVQGSSPWSITRKTTIYGGFFIASPTYGGMRAYR